MPRLPPAHVRALLLLALPCVACAGPTQTVQAPRLAVPASLVSCREQPEPPPEGVGDRELAMWILDLADAGADCRDRLRRVKELVQ
jgi:hypothetical protein